MMIETKLNNDNVIFSNLKEEDLLGSIDFILTMLRFDYRDMHGNCTYNIIKAYKEFFYKESLNKESIFSFPYIIESDDSIKCKTIKSSGEVRGDTVILQYPWIRLFSAEIPLTVLNEFDTYVIKFINKERIKKEKGEKNKLIKTNISYSDRRNMYYEFLDRIQSIEESIDDINNFIFL